MPDRPAVLFGRQLRAARERLGLSQRKLAARVHMTGPGISGYETGTRMPPLDYIGRLEWRQALEPQASRFDLTMTELPRLDDLVGLTNLRGDDPYGIFNGDARNPARHQPADELECLGLLRFLLLEPSGTGYRQMRAGREGQHHVPVNLPRGAPQLPVAE